MPQVAEQPKEPAPPPAPNPKRLTSRFIKRYLTPAQVEVDKSPMSKDGDIIIVIGADHLLKLHSSTMNIADSFFKN